MAGLIATRFMANSRTTHCARTPSDLTMGAQRQEASGMNRIPTVEELIEQARSLDPAHAATLSSRLANMDLESLMVKAGDQANAAGLGTPMYEAGIKAFEAAREAIAAHQYAHCGRSAHMGRPLDEWALVYGEDFTRARLVLSSAAAIVAVSWAISPRIADRILALVSARPLIA
jgi:hypothetical protein